MAVFNGTPGNDVIVVTSSDYVNTVYGGDGDDQLTGGPNQDGIVGGAGDDVIFATSGPDVYDGGVGSDTVDLSHAGVGYTIDLTREDRISTNGFAVGVSGGLYFTSVENIIGTAFDDSITGNQQDNMLEGGAGADLINGAGGVDTASYASAASGVTVSLLDSGRQDTHGAGLDLLLNIENLTGSAFNDALTGDLGANRLSGGLGDDVLNGAAGNDNLYGGAGDDTAVFSGSQDSYTVTGSAGNWTVVGQDGTDTLVSIEHLVFDTPQSHPTAGPGAGDDVLSGGSANDTLSAYGGQDRLSGGGGDDILYGGTGDDLLDGGPGNDTLNGGGHGPLGDTATYASALSGVHVDLTLYSQAQDTLGAGVDQLADISNLIGSRFDDTLIAVDAGARLFGGDGDDRLVGCSGYVIPTGAFYGGAGVDTLSLSLNQGVKLDLDLAGPQHIILAYPTAYLTLDGIENLEGGANSDLLYGSAVGNDLYGLGGQDVLVGRGGDDRLFGGDSNDRLTGDQGQNQLFGGAGEDTADYHAGYVQISADLLTGQASGTAAGGSFVDQLNGIEDVAGSAGSDTVSGDDTANLLQGMGGADTLRGRGGADRLEGGDGDDSLEGGLGDDILTGGAGVDTAIFSAARSAYVVTQTSGGYTVSGTDGVDTLTGVEYLRFSDRTVDIRVGGVNPDAIAGDLTTTTTLSLNATITGLIDTAGDVDWYRVELPPGANYHFTLTGDGGQPLDDPLLRLYDYNGSLMGGDDDSGPDHAASLYFNLPPNPAPYFYIAASDFGSATGGYSLTATPGYQDPLAPIDWGTSLASHQVNIYFAQTGETGDGGTASRGWTTAEIAAALAATQAIANVADLHFAQVSDRSQASIVMILDGSMPGSVFGSMTTPGNGIPAIGLFNPAVSNWTAAGALNPGGSGFQTLLHEFGHALGLAHPHDNGGSSEITQGLWTNSRYGFENLNQGVYTMMSYEDGWPGSAATPVRLESTPMALDVALLQQKYGAAAHNSGDNVYDLASVADQALVSIWDTGGTDAITYSGARNAVIDLRPASLDASQTSTALDSSVTQQLFTAGGLISYLDANAGGYTIAHGADIENAYGGAGHDFLVGNALANILIGGGNADILYGMEGDDLLYGGSGTDTLYGGQGADRLEDSDSATISGGDGDDVAVIGAGGSAIFDGGAGVDRIIVADAMANFQFAQEPGLDTQLHVFNNTTGLSLTNVEYIQFSDQTFHFSPGGGKAVDFTADPSTYAGALKDFDGNDVGATGSWVLAGHVDIQGDGDQEYILFNSQIGRWATMGPAADGKVYFGDYGWAGDTRVVGIYIDPEVQLGHAVQGGPDDSQRRFQNDLNIGNLKGILGGGDYNHDGLQEVYFSLTDGSAYLHAYMHADGNIQYANYQSQSQVTDYLAANGYTHTTWDGWF